MALTLTMIEGFLPPYAKAWSPVLYAFVAPLNAVLTILNVLFVRQLPIGTASGVWLTLRARDYGVERGDGEDDATLRARIRNVADALTLPSLQASLDAAMAPHSSVPVRIEEHWAAPLVMDAVLPDGLVLDNSNIFDGLVSITVFIPDFGITHPVYFAINNELNRLRGAGVKTTIIIEGSP